MMDVRVIRLLAHTRARAAANDLRLLTTTTMIRSSPPTCNAPSRPLAVGGNRSIIGCVLYNSCRESGDHGP
jgi:hypothetical protein